MLGKDVKYEKRKVKKKKIASKTRSKDLKLHLFGLSTLILMLVLCMKNLAIKLISLKKNLLKPRHDNTFHQPHT